MLLMGWVFFYLYCFQSSYFGGMCQDSQDHNMVWRTPHRRQPGVHEEECWGRIQKTNSWEALPTQRWTLAATWVDRRWVLCCVLFKEVLIFLSWQLFLKSCSRESKSWLSCCEVRHGTYLDQNRRETCSHNVTGISDTVFFFFFKCFIVLPKSKKNFHTFRFFCLC